MRRTIVTYKVRREHAATNEQLVRSVFAELERGEMTGFRYSVFVLEDGVSYVHVYESDNDDNPLNRLAAFTRYQEQIAEHLEGQAVVRQAREVGSFRG